MLRSTLTVAGRDFLLSQGTDADEVKRCVAAAFASGGGFVDFTVVGNREVSVYLTPGVGVIVENHTVEFDARDDGDLANPFDEFDDLIA